MWYNENVVAQKYGSKRSKTRTQKIGFEITKEQWMELFRLNGGKCDYTGMDMRLIAEPHDDDLVTVERIDSSRPYEIGNVCLVRQDVNLLKSNLFEFGLPISAERRTKIQMHVGIASTIFNPAALSTLIRKYDMDENGVSKDLRTQQAAIADKKEPTANESVGFFTYCDGMANGTNELLLSKSYYEFGTFVESCNGEFEFTFADYKARMRSKRCALTGRVFDDHEHKVLWVRDKTDPVSMANTFVTTVPMSIALDRFLVTSSLSVDELKHLVKALTK